MTKQIKGIASLEWKHCIKQEFCIFFCLTISLMGQRSTVTQFVLGNWHLWLQCSVSPQTWPSGVLHGVGQFPVYACKNKESWNEPIWMLVPYCEALSNICTSRKYKYLLQNILQQAAFNTVQLHFSVKMNINNFLYLEAFSFRWL